jgi:oligosaccharide repeat unit polymerase
LLTTIFLIPYFLKGIIISQEDSLAVLKGGLADLFENSPLEVIKIYWFCEPMVITSIIISSFIFFFIKKKLSLVILTIINVLLFSFAFGARIQMFRMCFILLIFLFFNFLVLGDKKFIGKRIKQSFLFIASFIIIMTVFTQERSWEKKVSFTKTFNLYFIGSFSLLDKFINNPSLSKIDKDYLYGRASLGSFIDPFLLLGVKTGVTNLTTDDLGVNNINKVSEQFYNVGKNYEMNAFCTMYYPFMRDFGLLGVFIFPFLLGSFLNWLLFKIQKTKDSFFFIAYIMFCYIMIFASNRWELVNFWPFGALVYTFLILKRYRKYKS